MLLHAEVADVRKRREKSFEDVKFFIDKFPAILSESADDIEQEFTRFQITPLHKNITEETVQRDRKAITVQRRMDSQWVSVSEITDQSDGARPFAKLAQVMLGILSIFHSNADSERIFSLVRKVKTELKGNMKIETLNNITTHKVLERACDVPCYNYHPQADLLKRCKGATERHNLSMNQKD